MHGRRQMGADRCMAADRWAPIDAWPPTDGRRWMHGRRQMAADQKESKKKSTFLNWLFSLVFFRDFPIRQNQLSQILMKPSLSILIFQPGLEFSSPRAVPEDRF
jgi:hypothetical protein